MKRPMMSMAGMALAYGQQPSGQQQAGSASVFGNGGNVGSGGGKGMKGGGLPPINKQPVVDPGLPAAQTATPQPGFRYEEPNPGGRRGRGPVGGGNRSGGVKRGGTSSGGAIDRGYGQATTPQPDQGGNGMVRPGYGVGQNPNPPAGQAVPYVGPGARAAAQARAQNGGASKGVKGGYRTINPGDGVEQNPNPPTAYAAAQNGLGQEQGPAQPRFRQRPDLHAYIAALEAGESQFNQLHRPNRGGGGV